MLSLTVCFLLFICSVAASSKEVTLKCGDEDATERGLPGAPGKRGPKGTSGIKGDRGQKGERGQADDTRSVVARLESKIDELESRLVEHAATISDLQRLSHGHTNKERSCFAGLKDRRVADNQMTASSFYPAPVHYPQEGRLGNTDGWLGVTGERYPWLQVDFRSPILMVGIVTQGRKSNVLIQWVTSFKIMYGDDVNQLKFIKSNNGEDMIFQGNRDKETEVANIFPQQIEARYIRLVVESYHQYPTLRMEVLTC